MREAKKTYLIDAMISIIRNPLVDLLAAKAASQVIYADGMFNMRIVARKNDGSLSEEVVIGLLNFAEEIDIEASAIARALESNPKNGVFINQLQEISDRLASHPV